MAYIQKDRVKETTTTNGTGAVTLAGAVAGFQAFSAVMSVADTCYYVIVSATGTDWETGTGTYSSASVLTRTTVLSSSNSGNAVSFTSGTKDVFMGPVAERVTDIAHGGTGATTAAGARTNLGVSTGTVTSVSGAGTVSGLTLTGTVTSSGSLTLGGTLSAISLTTGVSGTLPIANGGTNLAAIGSSKEILGVNAAGNALEYAGPYLFSYYKSVSQTLTNSTVAKITFETSEYDTTGCFASSRFTPNIAGYYKIDFTFAPSGGAGQQGLFAYLRKNGVDYKTIQYYFASTTIIDDFSTVGAAIVYLNGTTDYIELFGQRTGSTGIVSFGISPMVTFISGFLLR